VIALCCITITVQLVMLKTSSDHGGCCRMALPWRVFGCYPMPAPALRCNTVVVYRTLQLTTKMVEGCACWTNMDAAVCHKELLPCSSCASIRDCTATHF
jgi:hypothetical protein